MVMALQKRPIRARIYQPVTRLGVVATDWKYILIISLICYAVPMVLGLNVGGMPVFLLTGPGAMLVSYAFFFWTRIGRRPRWLQHYLRWLLSHPVERRVLPTDRQHFRHSWLR